MKASSTLAKNIYLSMAYHAMMGAFILAFFAAPVLADDFDPFQTDTGTWMSFQRYKDNVKRGIIIPQEKTAATSSDNASPDQQQTAPASIPLANTDSTASKTIIAAPSRPLVLPVMPGMNKGYNLQIDSTDDDKRAQAAPLINADGTTDVHLQAQNWLTAAEAARDAKRDSERAAAGQKAIDDHPPLEVRMSFLPDAKITPLPDPEHPRTHGRAPASTTTAAAPAPHTAEELKALPADLAACVAVVDAYKKKQLEALQSDRQTLTALQDAIAQLGLQKQLGYMMDAKSNLNAQAQNAPANAATTPAAAKGGEGSP